MQISGSMASSESKVATQAHFERTVTSTFPALVPLSRYDAAAKLLIDDIDSVLALGQRQLESLVSRLQDGCWITKFGRSGKPARRWLAVTPLADAVQYLSRRKGAAACTFPFSSIDRIQHGQGTSTFSRAPRPWRDGTASSALCLSIVAAGGRTLDVAFDTAAEADTWSLGIAALLLQQRVAAESSDDRWLRRAFAAEAGNEMGIVSFKGLLALTSRLRLIGHASTAGHSETDIEHLRTLARAASADVSLESNKLGMDPHSFSLSAFLRVVDLLRQRPDVEAIYAGLLQLGRADSSPCMRPLDEPERSLVGAGVLPTRIFSIFLRGNPSGLALDTPNHEPGGSDTRTLSALGGQGENVADSSAVSLAARLDPDLHGTGVGLPAFVAWLTSPSNAAFDPQAAVLHQDMSYPLPCYYIDSSHNTYLEGDQLAGGASVSPYLSAVQRGVRCVELDLWDGDAPPASRPLSRGAGPSVSLATGPMPVPGSQNEPTVTHGHTLTGRVSLSSVLTALAAHGFTTSPYPLILSLEVHASMGQQDVAASLLESAFGDRLARPSVPGGGVDGWSQLPSPEALRGKVIVKARLKKKATETEGLSVPINAHSHHMLGGTSVVEAASSIPAASIGCLPFLQSASTGRDKDAASQQMGYGTAGGFGNEPGKHLSDRLAALVYLPTVKLTAATLPSMDTSVQADTDYRSEGVESQSSGFSSCVFPPPPWCMASVKESKAERLLSTPGGAQAIASLTRHALVRVYPSILRVDSSNFSPCPYWAAGVQMAALNYQTHDIPTRLSRAWFRQNGRIGYVLKPRYLRQGMLLHEPTEATQSAAVNGRSGMISTVTPEVVMSIPGPPLPNPTAFALSLVPSDAVQTSITNALSSGPSSLTLPSRSTSPIRRLLRVRMRDAQWMRNAAGLTALSITGRPHEAETEETQGPTAFAEEPPMLKIPPSLPPMSPRLLSHCWGGEDSVSLVVTVMGGQLLPRRGEGGRALDAPSPFVTVLVSGDPVDAARARTSPVHSNGFNPVWGDTFAFRITRPATAVLYIAVHDALDAREKEGKGQGAGEGDGGAGPGNPSHPGSAQPTALSASARMLGHTASAGTVGPVQVTPANAPGNGYTGIPPGYTGRTSFLAYCAVPLPALRLGYRSCPLRNALGKKLPLCSLLLRLQRAPAKL